MLQKNSSGNTLRKCMYIFVYSQKHFQSFFSSYQLCSQCPSLPYVQESPFYLLSSQCFSRAGICNIGKNKEDEYNFEFFLYLFPACCIPCAWLKLSYLCCCDNLFLNCSNPVVIHGEKIANQCHIQNFIVYFLRLVQNT